MKERVCDNEIATGKRKTRKVEVKMKLLISHY